MEWNGECTELQLTCIAGCSIYVQLANVSLGLQGFMSKSGVTPMLLYQTWYCSQLIIKCLVIVVL